MVHQLGKLDQYIGCNEFTADVLTYLAVTGKKTLYKYK